jgi:hypothetical protein
MPDDTFDAERFRLTKPLKPRKKSPRMRHSTVPFVRTPLPWLADREFDTIYPPKTRLWLYLVHATREGLEPVRLTNRAAASVGLSREGKRRVLAHLEKVGRISIIRTGNRLPVVSLIMPAG